MSGLKPIHTVVKEAPELMRRVEALEAKLAAIEEGLRMILDRLAEIEKAEAVREEAKPAGKPAVAAPDLVETIPLAADDRPLGWLRTQLDSEKAMGNLNYRLVERAADVELSIWFSPDLPGKDRMKVQRWISWTKKTMGAKR